MQTMPSLAQCIYNGCIAAPECSRDEQNSAGEEGIRPGQEDASEEEKEGEMSVAQHFKVDP